MPLKMPRRVRVRPLAKVNLDLRVLHKRTDGFHELRTVFQTISLADSLEIEYETARRTDVTVEGNLNIPDNLVVRAARAVLDAMRVRARVHFRLEKRIPLGGGLGGGSSDAAAVLIALPVLAGRAVPLAELAGIGSDLGSDVPFFLTGGTAVGLGRGTELYELPDIAEEPILVVSPGLHVATGPAYQALARSLTFTESSSSINNFQGFVRALGGVRSAERVMDALSANDFEAVVFRQYPKLKTIQAKLRKLGDVGTRMTGSGSAIFAVFGSRQERERAREKLDADKSLRGCRIMPAKLVSRRSYQRLWRRQLRDHLIPEERTWPPRSRYER
jgi:4-diphosphocytidyl-2-C-methyl-D-erythritol kinase